MHTKKGSRIRTASNPSKEHVQREMPSNVYGNLLPAKLPIKCETKTDIFQKFKSLKPTCYSTFLKKWSDNILQQNEGQCQERIRN